MAPVRFEKAERRYPRSDTPAVAGTDIARAHVFDTDTGERLSG